MKKALKRYFRMVLFCFIIIIISLFLLKITINSNNDIIFKEEYTNDAWSHNDYGYYIYKDGTIKQYDNSKPKVYSKLNEAKISKDELKELIKLAKTINDEIKIIDTKNGSLLDRMSATAYDAGMTQYSVYSDNLAKFILLREASPTPKINTSDNTEKLLNYTDTLYNKYLNDIFQ